LLSERASESGLQVKQQTINILLMLCPSYVLFSGYEPESGLRFKQQTHAVICMIES